MNFLTVNSRFTASCSHLTKVDYKSPSVRVRVEIPGLAATQSRDFGIGKTSGIRDPGIGNPKQNPWMGNCSHVNNVGI